MSNDLLKNHRAAFREWLAALPDDANLWMEGSCYDRDQPSISDDFVFSKAQLQKLLDYPFLSRPWYLNNVTGLAPSNRDRDRYGIPVGDRGFAPVIGIGFPKGVPTEEWGIFGPQPDGEGRLYSIYIYTPPQGVSDFVSRLWA